MSTDLKQFHDAFFEESLEATDDMESGLLNLDITNIDPESINTIFRGAHSIKGCSATFGFNDISTFVHVMETVLDEMRDGSLTPDQNSVDVLLESLDALRAMLVNTRDDKTVDQTSIDTARDTLENILNDKDKVIKPGDNKVADLSNDEISTEWDIVFKPHLDIFKSGNDPHRMLGVLAELGELDVKTDVSELVDFRIMDPKDCYLTWNIHLTGDASKDQIMDVFEWVADESELTIEPVKNTSKSDNNKTSPIHSDATSNTPGSSENSAYSVSGDAASIRVGIDKVDEIINMVGELVITQSMLDQLGEEIDEGSTDQSRLEKLRAGLIQLERNTRELQESVMRIRMLPISYVFNRVPRIVHDLSKKLDKQVNVNMTGENTELDKTVLEKIGDPLVHLIRNALDHGIENPETRQANGKPEIGTINLNAYHQGGNIIVEIKDDGAGLDKDKITNKAIDRGLIDADDEVTDEQIYDLIFHAGLSTAEIVSDVSGRGVGMDVVRKNIKSLGGNIEVKSVKGEGTSFTIRLPLTLAILDGQLVRVADETYIVPLVSIVESLQLNSGDINVIAGQAEVYRLRDEYIPCITLRSLFGDTTKTSELDGGLMVIVEGDGKRAGLIVDDLLAQQQVVIKSLETNFKRVDGLSGATILGDGTVALIADVAGLIELSHSVHSLCSTIPSKEKDTGVAA